MPALRHRRSGVEVEFAFDAMNAATGEPDATYQNNIVKRLINPLDETKNEWSDNGSRLYVDVGSHPEAATPECPDDYRHGTAVYERADERVLTDRVAVLQQEENKSSTPRLFVLAKNNIERGKDVGASWGCHENYLVHRPLPGLIPERLIQTFIPYFVTRQIVFGAGNVVMDGSGYEFYLSQRGLLFSEKEGPSTTGPSRGIFNIRDEPHADDGRTTWLRMHVICGDSSILYEPMAYKTRIMSLLVEMYESGDLAAIELADPVLAMKAVCRDYRAKVMLADGTGYATALDVQWHYYDQAYRYTYEHDLPYKAALAWWRYVLTALEDGDLARLEGRVDWVTKYRLIRVRERRFGHKLTLRQALDLNDDYHRLFGGTGLPHKLRARFDPPWLELAVSRAMVCPPPTRAKFRVLATRALLDGKAAGSIDWHEIRLNSPGQCIDRKLHPTLVHDRDLENQLRRLNA